MHKKEFFERFSIDISNGRLGGGAFGTVYKAYDNLTDQWKAIKVAEVKYIADKKFSLISEFDATKKLETHKNIANYESVFQFEMENGIFDYAIMQFYNEGNLKQLITKRKLGVHQKVAIINGLLAGIAFLHNNKIIHRDLKPSNILISKDFHGNFIPKIADFGLSKIIDDEYSLMLSNSFQGGTLEYSPPEQLYGKKLGYNADLWSFGVICFEILTNKKPFASDDVSGSVEAKRTSIYKNIVSADISEAIEECPYPYDQIIKKCLVKDPQVRVKKGQDLVEFLRNPEVKSNVEEGEADETLMFTPGNKEINPLESVEIPDVLSPKVEDLKKNYDDLNEKIKNRFKEFKRDYDKNKQLRKEKKAEENRIREERAAKKKEEAELTKKRLEEARRKEAEKQKAEEEARRVKEQGELKRRQEKEKERLEKEQELLRIKREEDERIKREEELKQRKVENKRREREAQELKIRKAEEHARRKKEQERKKQREEELRIRKAKQKKEREEQEALKRKQREEQKRIKKEERKRRIVLFKTRYSNFINRLGQQLTKNRKYAIAALSVFALSFGVNQVYSTYITGPLIFSKSGKYGCKSQEGKVLVNPIFDEIKPFSWGKAEAIKGDSIFQINKDGNLRFVEIVVPPKEEILSDNFENDLLQAETHQEVEKLKKIYGGQEQLSKINAKLDQLKDQEKEAFDKVISSDDINLYEDFLKNYPDSEYKDQVEVRANKIIENTLNQNEDKLYQMIISNPSRILISSYKNSYPNGKYIQQVNDELKEYEKKEELTEWNKAKSKETINAYEKYLKKYPNGQFVNDANKVIINLKKEEEKRFWTETKKRDNIEAYRAYLKKYSNGLYADQANKKLEEKMTADAKEVDKKSMVVLENDKEIKSGIENIQRFDLDKGEKSDLERLINKIRQSNDPSKKSVFLKELKSLQLEVENARKELVLAPLIEELEKSFVRLQSIEYTLGCDDKDCERDEKPTIQISIPSFAISKYEVTQKFWKQVMGDNPSFYNDGRSGNYPVENVSYLEVLTFIDRLNSLEGNPYNYRLPTEAEWEYAASGGNNFKYAGSNNVDEVAQYGVTDGTARVGRKKANSYKLYDMSGNVAEYTSDWYNKYDEANKSKKYIVIRGGSWRNKSKTCRVKSRKYINPSDKNMMTGFRLVRNIKR